MSKNGNSVFLLSRYILCRRVYNDVKTDVTWETCSLRSWLNNDFYYSTFNTEEKSRIQTTLVINEDHPEFGTPGGNNTYDKVFLLSNNEASTYFKTDAERMCYPSPHLLSTGFDPGSTIGTGEWWLRSPGNRSENAVLVTYYGQISPYGSVIYRRDVRPALWYDLGP